MLKIIFKSPIRRVPAPPDTVYCPGGFVMPSSWASELSDMWLTLPGIWTVSTSDYRQGFFVVGRDPDISLRLPVGEVDRIECDNKVVYCSNDAQYLEVMLMRVGCDSFLPDIEQPHILSRINFDRSNLGLRFYTKDEKVVSLQIVYEMNELQMSLFHDDHLLNKTNIKIKTQA